MCYHDDYWDSYETEKERAERKAWEHQERQERLMRQLQCPHARYVKMGTSKYVTVDGDVGFTYTVYCPDCGNEEEMDYDVWQARAEKAAA